MSLACKSLTRIELLRDRAHMLKEARNFFDERGVLEVDCPILSAAAPIDRHIDVMKVVSNYGPPRYLHTSPEYPMKRLLAEGIGDIYQICHVFRDGECGHLHNPEFTMAEWYRTALSFEDLIVETIDFIRLFLGHLPFRILTYRETFLHFAELDVQTATQDELIASIEASSINYEGDLSSLDRDTLLQMIMSFLIEPSLGDKELTVVKNFPASQAALSKKEIAHGELVAKRFEVYYKGIELANGYDELANGKEQHERFIEENKVRVGLNKEALPIDENLIHALKNGFPECRGVAVGFDRLLLLRHQKQSLEDLIPFTWNHA
jgi:elongation factor P--(R)-beta-lysine ligase